jgi:hypothetical protein
METASQQDRQFIARTWPGTGVNALLLIIALLCTAANLQSLTGCGYWGPRVTHAETWTAWQDIGR